LQPITDNHIPKTDNRPTKMTDKKNIPFQILTIGIFILLIVPTLIQDGMFMDGQQYACVAKNLANGLGTFWQPFVVQPGGKAAQILFLNILLWFMEYNLYSF